MDILVEANPEIDSDLESQGIGLLAPLWEEEGVPFGDQTAERWESLAAWMKSEGLLGEDVDAADGLPGSHSVPFPEFRGTR